MSYEYPASANQLADLMRVLRSASSDREFRYAREKVRRFLESHGCTVMPWADGRTSACRRVQDAAQTQDAGAKEEGEEAANPEGSRIIQLYPDGARSAIAAETIPNHMDLPASDSASRNSVCD